jgi:hypothetical protein
MDASASPQMSLLPAPISSQTAGPTAVVGPTRSDAGAVQRAALPLRTDVAVAADRTGQESAYAMVGHFRIPEGPPFVRNHEGGELLRKKLELRTQALLTPTRLGLTFSGAFVPASGSHLRARTDRLGFFLFDPTSNFKTYQILAPNALRSWLDEGRFDVAMSQLASEQPLPELSRRLGFRTRSLQLETVRGKVTLELALAAESGGGGELLCRVFSELLGAPSAQTACGIDEIPVRAEYRWAQGGGLLFEATKLEKRTETTDLAAPPADASMIKPTAFRHHFFLGASELGDLRPNGNKDAASLLIENPSDRPKIVSLDGIPVVAVEARSVTALALVPRGKYQVYSHTFLGELVEARGVREVPARLILDPVVPQARPESSKRLPN